MWAMLRNVAVAGYLYRFLRPRWKRLAVCLGVVAAAFYIHGEYLSYLNALPDAEVPREFVAWAFVLKNVVIAVSLLAVLLPEFRSARHGGRWMFTSANRSKAGASHTTEDSPETADDHSNTQRDRPRVESDDTDPFQRIRRKPVIRTRAEQILSRER